MTPPIYNGNNITFTTTTSGTTSNDITFNYNGPWLPDDKCLIAKTRNGWKLYQTEQQGLFFFHAKDCNVQLMKVGKKVICPSCGSNPPKRLLSTAALINPNFMTDLIGFEDYNHTIGNSAWKRQFPNIQGYTEINPSVTFTNAVSQSCTLTTQK